MVSNQLLVGVGRSVGGFELGGWHVVAVAVETAGVVPVDPAERGEFDVVDRLPWTAIRPVDQFGFVVAVQDPELLFINPKLVDWLIDPLVD